MSWSIQNKCSSCVKHSNCLGTTYISSGIDIAHRVGEKGGHLGAGTVEMHCQNYQAKEDNQEKQN